MPSAAASRSTSTGKCFLSSHSTAWGARLSAAKARAMSRMAIWSSVRENWLMGSIVTPEEFWATMTFDLGQPSGMSTASETMAGTEPGHCAFLLHRRNRKLRAFLDARGPAGGDGLGLGVEAHRVRAVLVEVAEARGLPAAEGVVGQRHRARHGGARHAQ